MPDYQTIVSFSGSGEFTEEDWEPAPGRPLRLLYFRRSGNWRDPNTEPDHFLVAEASSSRPATAADWALYRRQVDELKGRLARRRRQVVAALAGLIERAILRDRGH